MRFNEKMNFIYVFLNIIFRLGYTMLPICTASTKKNLACAQKSHAPENRLNGDKKAL